MRALDFSGQICDTILIYEMGANAVLRAMFAGFVFELHGCDAMHNADKFARFPASEAAADCRIVMTVQAERLQPCGEPLYQTGSWQCYSHGERKRFYLRDATQMIEATADFSQVHLFFRDGIPKAEIIRYLTVQQMIHMFLLHHGGVMLHSSGLSVDGRGVLLCGRSGVGKSTMTAQLKPLVNELTVLSEDMPALVRCGNRITVCGTPLCGNDEQCESGTAPLTKIVFLRHASENRLLRPTEAEAMYELLTVLARAAYAPQAATAATDWGVTLVSTVPVVIFENDGTEQAAKKLLQYIQNEPRDEK